MSHGAEDNLCLVRRLTTVLTTWPAMTTGRAEDGNGTVFTTSCRSGSRPVVRLYGDEVEVNLTWPVVARMREALDQSGRVAITSGGDWVRLRLDTVSDVELVISLASVAIQAATPAAPAHRASPRPHVRVRDGVLRALRARRIPGHMQSWN